MAPRVAGVSARTWRCRSSSRDRNADVAAPLSSVGDNAPRRALRDGNFRNDARPIVDALCLDSVLAQGACSIALLAAALDVAERYGAMLLDHTGRHPIRQWQVWARCFNGLVIAR
jgi:hypothetical protein